MNIGIDAIVFKMLPTPPTINSALLGTPVGVGVGSTFTGGGGVGGAVGGGIGGGVGVGAAGGGVGGAFHLSLSTQVLQ